MSLRFALPLITALSLIAALTTGTAALAQTEPGAEKPAKRTKPARKPKAAGDASASPTAPARRKGGTTTVVAYGFCVPMDYLIQATLTRGDVDLVVDDKKVGTMRTCSFKTFKVKSGTWSTRFDRMLNFPTWLGEQTFRPGATQYLHIYPAGQGTFYGEWVSKAQADQGITAIRKIGQAF